LPLNPEGDNVGTLHSAPGYSKFSTFCAECESQGLDDASPIALETHIIPDDDSNGESSDSDSVSYDELHNSNSGQLYAELPANSLQTQEDKPLIEEFDLDGPISQDRESLLHVVEDKEDNLKATPAEFLKVHHRLGHMSPDKIRILASQGLLPAQLAKCNVPMCTRCLFGKATRRPWRFKPAANKTSSKSVTTPGQIVSVDQLISSTPGLIAQLKGILTRKRYTVTTVFVNQYSGLSYVHLQMSTTAIETLEAKCAFERYAAKHGVTIKHYHVDNGRFIENAFVEDVNAQRQTNSFCGVNAHFQNGIAERCIRELQDQARTMLIHANHRWPTAVNAHLWPYALCMANDLHNAAPSLSHKSHQSPFELFTGVKVAPNLQHFKTFGCPVYVLDTKLQGQRSFNKWTERARIGMYLGLSPSHA
jgi:phosphoglycolate phosphatase-like HAD superfamily hydrolase